MQGATFHKNENLDPKLFISFEDSENWCAYLLRENESFEETTLDFKTIWEGTGSRNATKYRGDFLFGRKCPDALSATSDETKSKTYNQAIRKVLAKKINVPYSIALVWLLEPNETPGEANTFVIPLWEQSNKQYQIALESTFSFGIGELTAFKAVRVKSEFSDDYTALLIPTGTKTGLTNRPHAIEFGLQLKNGEIPSARQKTQIKKDNYISIPLSGSCRGAFRFEMTLLEQDDLLNFDLGQKYFYQNGSFTELSYPFLKSGREHYEALCQVSFDPSNVSNQPSGTLDVRPNQTYIAFTGETNYKLSQENPDKDLETVFDTFFNSETGYGLQLKPYCECEHSHTDINDFYATRDSARLVLTRKGANPFDLYFAPAGDFYMEYNEEGLPEELKDDPAQLLTGLSGTESIGFQPKKEEFEGDKMRFRPYNPAFAKDFDGTSFSSNDALCKPQLISDLSATTEVEELNTSWVNILPNEANGQVLYYAQAEGASLYSKHHGIKTISDENFDDEDDTEKIELLGHFEPAVVLPKGEAYSDFVFPLVPYLGSQGSEVMANLENKVLQPIRKQKIGKDFLAHVVPAGTATSTEINAATPQGLVAKVEQATGDWSELILAENAETADNETGPNYSNHDITDTTQSEFKFGFVNLQSKLQEAFQTNQQFLVVTDATNLGDLFNSHTGEMDISTLSGSEAIFNNKMFIDDWPFIVKTGENGNETGEYRNVLIFKFCKGSLLERIQNPALWTNPCDFNGDQTTDPYDTSELAGVSSWINQYFENAKGQQSPYFDHFQTLIEDENWNGILALKVDLAAGDFPEGLKGLLGGINQDRLNIHHFGIEMNRVAASEDKDIHLSEYSSMFGLINYLDEAYELNLLNGVDPNLPVTTSTSPYDFKVLSLQVLFENSNIKDFASKIQVSMDELFKEAVPDTYIVQPSVDENKLSSNSIVLNGTYEEHNGRSVYTFATTESTFFELNSFILQHIEFERAIFETLSSVDNHIKSRFSFWGNISFEEISEGDQINDLLSFGWEVDAAEGRGLTFNNLQLAMDFHLDGIAALPDVDECTRDTQGRCFKMITDFFEPFLKNSYSRENGLFSKFPLDFQGFVFGSSQNMPSELGYQTILLQGNYGGVDWGISTENLTTDWYGLKYKMNMGTLGELASDAGLEASFMIAWSPNGNSAPKLFLGMILPGPGGPNKMLNLQNIISLSIGDLELDFHENSGAYELRFRDIGFKFFNFLKIPFFAEANFHLFANANSTDRKNLGWFLNYAEPVSPKLVNVIFLALGQHVTIVNGDFGSMKEAIAQMEEAFITHEETSFSNLIHGDTSFDVIEPETDLYVDFDASSNWLVALHFGLLAPKNEPTQYAIEASVLFNDPTMYGLYIAASGDAVKFMDGLEFEIFYQKIDESTGMYRGELTIPSELRSFKLGAATITLPTIAAEIYTNGDFLIDLGFPYGRDFSRSLDVEVQAGPFPIVGAIGIYFGKLSGNTAKNLPTIAKEGGEPIGKFDPVIVIGIGAEVGLGKSFEEGPLSAEIAVTVVGIIEGIAAKWLPNDPASASDDFEESFYMKVNGTFGIVGILTGSVDFKVIKAGVEVELYALADIIYESFRAIPITLSAGVEVKVTVKVDLGLFTVKEDFSYSEHIETTFEIMEDRIGQEPWSGASGMIALSAVQTPTLIPITSETKQALDLYFNLAHTLSDKTTGSELSCVALLMMKSADTQDITSSGTAFDLLAEQVFRWMANGGASLPAGSTSTDFDDKLIDSTYLQSLLDELLANPNILRPISKEQINDFLNDNFVLNIETGASDTFDDAVATIFPMVPDFGLELSYDPNGHSINSFEAYNNVTQNYLINTLEAFFGDTKYKTSGNSASVEDVDPNLSLAEYNFEDYFVLIARHMVTNAIKSFKKYNYYLSEHTHTIIDGESLSSITTIYNNSLNPVTIESIAIANQSHLIKDITIDGITHSELTFEGLAGELGKTIEALAQQLKDEADLFDKTEESDLKIPNHSTLALIQAHFGVNNEVSIEDIAIENQFHKLSDPTSGENLYKRAITENKTVGELAEELKDVAGLFDIIEDAYLTIPNLTCLSIGEILDDLFANNITANLSGIAMRTQLHGLRLPKTDELNYFDNKGEEFSLFTDDIDYSFYKLLGQQFLLPKTNLGDWPTTPGEEGDDAKTTDAPLTIKLIEGETIKASIAYSKTEVSNKYTEYATAKDDADLSEGFKAVSLYKEVPHEYKFKSFHEYNGDLLWNFSDNFLHYLSGASSEGLDNFQVTIGMKNGAKGMMEYLNATNARWGTKINLTIRRYPDATNAFRYELMGTDEIGITLLERYIKAGLDPSDIRLMHPKVIDNGDETFSVEQDNLESLNLNEIYTFINQANLSTETNPIIEEAMMAAMASQSGLTPGIQNTTHLDFIKLIWKCSVVQTGGYYLYYEDVSGATFPSIIFEEDNTAKICLLINHSTGSTLANYMNCVLTDADIDTQNAIVFAEATDLKDKCPFLPQGVFAYELSRTKPTGETAADLLASSYHLLSYRIWDNNAGATDDDGNPFGDWTRFSMPIGPTNDLSQEDAVKRKRVPGVDDGNWLYKLKVPFYKYAMAQSFDAPFDAVENIYAGVGTDARIQVCWKDLYGNCIFDFIEKQTLDPLDASSGTSSIRIGYTDKMLALNQWPNVEYFYEVIDGNLNIQLRYRIQDFSNDASNDRKNEHIRMFEKIFLQLNQQGPDADGTTVHHVDTLLTSSLFNDGKVLELSDLNAFITAVYQNIINNELPAADSNVLYVIEPGEEDSEDKNYLEYTIATPIVLSELNSANIYELEVALNFERKKYFVHDDFKKEASVLCAITAVPPYLETEELNDVNGVMETSRISKLTQFASNFESTIATVGDSLKIATGINKDELNTKGKVKDIWVVRLDNSTFNFNYDPSAEHPAYYALKPFSTNLVSGDLNVYQYESGTGLKTSTDDLIPTAFSEIDIDSWMRQFLEAVDLFLSPQYTTGAFLVDKLNSSNHVKTVTDAKKEIAAALVEQMAEVLPDTASVPTTAALKEAKKKLEQRLLIKLSEAYKVNTVVQFPLNAANTATGNTDVPKFYGMPNVKGESDREYSFSTSKVNLDGSPSSLTFLFSTKHEEADDQAFVNLGLNYQISHLQHRFETPIDDYEVSSWLAFVLPPDVNSALLQDLGDVQIPVVLRAFPTAPALVSQAGLQSSPEVSRTALENATQWDYHLKYAQNAAGQDTIKAEIALNGEGTAGGSAEISSHYLMESLGRFMSLYPGILNDLAAQLPLINAQSTDTAIALGATSAFARLVSEVCTAMTSTQAAMMAAVDLNEKVLYEFEIQEQKIDGNLNVRVEHIQTTPDTHLFDLPIVKIDGYESDQANPATYSDENTGQVLDWDTAKGVKERTAVLENLDILKYQNGGSGIWLTRNEDLSDTFDTNPDFIYRTPFARFPNTIVPFLDNQISINIKTEIEAYQKKQGLDEEAIATNLASYGLKHYLRDFFKLLLDKGQGDDVQSIKLECGYAYQIKANSELPEIVLPILLAPPTDFSLPADLDDTDEQSFISKLATAIEAWFNQNQPADHNLNERFLLDVSIFSKVNDSKLPIVRLRNVFLYRDDVSE